MRNIDFSSWHGLVATVIGIGLVTLIGVGVRLLLMMTIQQRRERMNRQINERLRTLIAAYKTLGGSFTGDLTVNPAHLRDLPAENAGSDRARRIRDAVEAALSDIILLGTETHVRLAERAARELISGRIVHTHELVVALRDFIREALDLAPIPRGLEIPMQGPARPSSASGGRGKDEGGKDRKAGGGGGAGIGMGVGGGMGMGLGLGLGTSDSDGEPPPSENGV